MSKYILFEFRCEECGSIFDGMTKPDVYEAECPTCGTTGSRVASRGHVDKLKMAHGESASPECIDYFDRVHRQQRDKEKKCEAEHGDYGAAPGAD